MLALFISSVPVAFPVSIRLIQEKLREEWVYFVSQSKVIGQYGKEALKAGAGGSWPHFICNHIQSASLSIKMKLKARKSTVGCFIIIAAQATGCIFGR